jgi:hypothetical protein
VPIVASTPEPEPVAQAAVVSEPAPIPEPAAAPVVEASPAAIVTPEVVAPEVVAVPEPAPAVVADAPSIEQPEEEPGALLEVFARAAENENEQPEPAEPKHKTA